MNRSFYLTWIATVTISVFVALVLLFFTYHSFWPEGLFWAILTALLIVVPPLFSARLLVKIAVALLGYIGTAFIFIGPLFSRGSLELEAIGFIFTLAILLVTLLGLVVVEHFKSKRALAIISVIIFIIGIYFAISLIIYLAKLQESRRQTDILYDIRQGRYSSVEAAINTCQALNGNTVRNHCFYDLAMSQRFLRKDLCARFVDDDSGDRPRTKEDWIKLCNTEILKN